MLKLSSDISAKNGILLVIKTVMNTILKMFGNYN